jgi:hypothetical protein
MEARVTIQSLHYKADSLPSVGCNTYRKKKSLKHDTTLKSQICELKPVSSSSQLQAKRTEVHKKE